MVDRFNPEKVGSGETLGKEWRRKEGWVPPLPETSGWDTLLPAHRDPVPSPAVTCQALRTGPYDQASPALHPTQICPSGFYPQKLSVFVEIDLGDHTEEVSTLSPQ